MGKINENGQRLLELCSYHGLCVTNSYFQTKPQHGVSWRQPRSKHWNQLDMVIVKRISLKFVLCTRTYHSGDYHNDHSIVCRKIRLLPKKIHCSKQVGKPHIDTIKMQCPDKVEEFAKSFVDALTADHQHNSVSEKWDHVKEPIHKTALVSFGRKTTKNCDWFEAKSSEMTPVIEAKSAALAEYMRLPSKRSLQALRAARNKVQQTTRRCANEYWQQLSDDIQTAVVTGNIRGMYEGIKKAVGPIQSKTAPLKSSSGEEITDKGQEMERWLGHYSQLYSRENVVVTFALDAIEPLPIMGEPDAETTFGELSKAIDSLACGKAPGIDGIPPDLIKHCKTTLLQPLHDLLCQCWSEGAVPQDMRDAKIVTLYKNKGDRSDCSNYRGISLLSVVGKLYAPVVLLRLQQLAERVFPESQCSLQ